MLDKIFFAEMYWFRQYLSIDPKNVCHAHLNAHKPQKIVNTRMNVDISETIKYRELRSQT